MAHTSSTAHAARERQRSADFLLQRLREQFPELAVADLVEAAVGVPPLPGPDLPVPAGAATSSGPPRHRA